MLRGLFKKTVGEANPREIARLQKVVERINALEPAFETLDDTQLQAKTGEFRQRLAEGETLDDLLVEAFAAVREAAKRTIGLRHYDVQLIGGIALHQGHIAEMKTGEGKTLVATLPLYLNALAGKGAHLVTPNDYLSKVGVQWMGPIYHALGLPVGVIQSAAADPNRGSFIFDPDYPSADDRFLNLRPVSRREAYRADITYGTNNEFGFDYLRDNMVRDLSECVQRELTYAIIDEVDNILIDEARTPLIISGPAEESSELYGRFADVARRLRPSSPESVEQEEPDGDYVLEERTQVVTLTEHGVERVEQMLPEVGAEESIYDTKHAHMLPYLDNALRATVVYKRDKDYIVKDGEVIIVDQFTGRLMYGRRFSEGLHQAIEATEGVEVRRESLTYATVTFQNYFRMYEKLAGMTGTAETEASEFWDIYKLDVMVIPTNVPVVRTDVEDQIYRTRREKYNAIINEIVENYRRGRPVLVGTVSVEVSETLSRMLKRTGINHNVLNAKQHQGEAEIVAYAGEPGAVTIATNMAGRGTDIKLGAGVIDVGGLHIVGTERHESRRIDRQLRGRSGRQGDPGSSIFFLSLEDDLMRLFGGERLGRIMDRLGVQDGEVITHRMVTRAIERAQKKVELQNFAIRKHTLDYDDVMNVQRRWIYERRLSALERESIKDEVLELIDEVLDRLIDEFCAESEYPENWNLNGFTDELRKVFLLNLRFREEDVPGLKVDKLRENVRQAVMMIYTQKETAYGDEIMRQLERYAVLSTIDRHWRDHLAEMDELRAGIGLRAYHGAMGKPIDIYKREAFGMFQSMVATIDKEIVNLVFKLQVNVPEPSRAERRREGDMVASHADTTGMGIQSAVQAPEGMPQAAGPNPMAEASQAGRQIRTVRRASAKVGRNDPCPCGSGKKYKKCHGKET